MQLHNLSPSPPNVLYDAYAAASRFWVRRGRGLSKTIPIYGHTQLHRRRFELARWQWQHCDIELRKISIQWIRINSTC